MRIPPRVENFLWNRSIGWTCWATAGPWRNRLLGRPIMRLFGALTLRVKQGKSPSDIEGLAREWQRMFPSPRMVPLVGVEEDVAFAEIHVSCPYRGTGNVDGCYRMMEYDRRLLESLGGHFVVLESQAEPGVERCRVAMAQTPEALEHLEAAHLRAKRVQQ